jgi:glucose/arabinose dehydrogenase
MRRLALLPRVALGGCLPLALAGCTTAPTPGPSEPAPSATAETPSAPPSAEPTPTDSPSPIPDTHELDITVHETFDEPWAMAFLPGTDELVITGRQGDIWLRGPDGVRQVDGAPEVVAAGQGGLGDIIPDPTFEADGRVYLSWVEGDGGTSGAVVGTGTLDVRDATLTGLDVIWEQAPKVSGNGHFSHRLAIRDDHLFVSSGDRQKMEPAQELDGNLGKILRLTLDGQPAAGNPFQGEGVARQFWSIGHRNVLGLAFDADGRLWASEMGPEGGDELNLITPGANYGWPEASNGSHYGGGEIPDHEPGDGFEAPKVWWNPSVSPGSLMIYHGDLFPAWTGDAFLGALSGEALIRVDLDGEDAELAEDWPMDARIRAVAEAPDGAIWLLEDGDGARLLELRPA